MEHKIEFLQFRLRDVAVNLNIDEKFSGELNLEMNLSLREPKDQSNPTAMIEFDAKFEDENDVVKCSCRGDVLVEILPLPSEWMPVVKDHCIPLIHNQILERFTSILNAMGLSISPDE